jgi:hypothetical protein
MIQALQALWNLWGMVAIYASIKCARIGMLGWIPDTEETLSSRHPLKATEGGQNPSCSRRLPPPSSSTLSPPEASPG